MEENLTLQDNKIDTEETEMDPYWISLVTNLFKKTN